MADKKAVATGLWSDTATWDGGTLPASGDDVYTNNFIVTVDQTITAKLLRTVSGTGITQGGHFLVSSATGQTITVTDGILGSHAYAVSGGQVLRISAASGTLNVVANMTGGSSNLQIPCRVIAGANLTLNITGDILGGSSASARYALVVEGSVSVKASPTLTINGDLVGMSSSAVWLYNSDSAVTINGNATGGSGSAAHGLEVAAGSIGSSPTISVDNAIGGSGTNACGIYATVNNGSPQINVLEYCDGGTVATGYGVATSGALRCTLGYRWGVFGAPPTSGTNQRPMIARAGEDGFEFYLPSDDNWPDANGDDIVLSTGGGGGEPPTSGVGWPPRYYG